MFVFLSVARIGLDIAFSNLIDLMMELVDVYKILLGMFSLVVGIVMGSAFSNLGHLLEFLGIQLSNFCLHRFLGIRCKVGYNKGILEG